MAAEHVARALMAMVDSAVRSRVAAGDLASVGAPEDPMAGLHAAVSYVQTGLTDPALRAQFGEWLTTTQTRI